MFIRVLLPWIHLCMGIWMAMEINVFCFSGAQCWELGVGISFTCPPGRVASTIRPTRDQSHIDVLCEHELMDFTLTCKHSPSQSCWECWDLCLYVLSLECTGVEVRHVKPATLNAAGGNCYCSEVLASPFSPGRTMDLFLLTFPTHQFPISS